MKPKIRLATAYDIDAVFEIEKLCFDKLEQFDKNFFYLFLMRRNFEIFFVATIEDKVKENRLVGFIIAYLNKIGNYEIATINVHPDFRNQKIGFQLMAELEKAIKVIFQELVNSKKIDENSQNIIIELTVHDKNEAAIALYDKLEYKKIEIISNYYQKGKNGIRMIKSLNLM
ncbi:MAG: GNAT family N-acetyltransferase [Candidatus Heimdallarchaeota archaeon]|nr:GNAT family N-acetyltransferase [Candidatus Heimdallarchaeota archaeon]MBY8994317.1 GNAT family N-acetyltransferase [Candidatus Heimdallarchaeota archaeon]